jgi:hypothetical protein
VFTYPDSKAQIICNIPRFARKIAGLPKTGIYNIANKIYDIDDMK